MENMPLGGYGEQYGEYALGGGVWRTVWRICLLGGYGEYAFGGGMENSMKNMPSRGGMENSMENSLLGGGLRG